MRTIVAVTGGIGSGKSALCTVLAELSAAYINADDSAHAALQPGTTAATQVAEAFPDCVRDGVVDRALLAARVFGSAQARQLLEEIVHPWVRVDVNTKLSRVAADVAVVEIPLLAETRTRLAAQAEFTCVVAVWAPVSVRATRAVAAGFTESDFRSRLAAQADDAGRFAVADLVIPNAGSTDELRRHAVELMARLRRGTGRAR
ncbi:MAG: dephospho-CoA kinase [Actinobacteria bacterium]|nr:dephospho-CoA kinase [Actinomycetota bacterium]